MMQGRHDYTNRELPIGGRGWKAETISASAYGGMAAAFGERRRVNKMMNPCVTRGRQHLVSGNKMM